MRQWKNRYCKFDPITLYCTGPYSNKWNGGVAIHEGEVSIYRIGLHGSVYSSLRSGSRLTANQNTKQLCLQNLKTMKTMTTTVTTKTRCSPIAHKQKEKITWSAMTCKGIFYNSMLVDILNTENELFSTPTRYADRSTVLGRRPLFSIPHSTKADG